MGARGGRAGRAAPYPPAEPSHAPPTPSDSQVSGPAPRRGGEISGPASARATRLGYRRATWRARRRPRHSRGLFAFFPRPGFDPSRERGTGSSRYGSSMRNPAVGERAEGTIRRSRPRGVSAFAPARGEDRQSPSEAEAIVFAAAPLEPEGGSIRPGGWSQSSSRLVTRRSRVHPRARPTGIRTGRLRTRSYALGGRIAGGLERRR